MTSSPFVCFVKHFVFVMSVTCILHGNFEDLLPPDHDSNEITLSASTPAEVIAHFDIDPDMVHYVILDGQYIEEDDWQTPLTENSVIRLWPRIAGG